MGILYSEKFFRLLNSARFAPYASLATPVNDKKNFHSKTRTTCPKMFRRLHVFRNFVVCTIIICKPSLTHPLVQSRTGFWKIFKKIFLRNWGFWRFILLSRFFCMVSILFHTSFVSKIIENFVSQSFYKLKKNEKLDKKISGRGITIKLIAHRLKMLSKSVQ